MGSFNWGTLLSGIELGFSGNKLHVGYNWGAALDSLEGMLKLTAPHIDTSNFAQIKTHLAQPTPVKAQ